MDAETLLDLTVIAHRLWCARMIAAGWRCGPRFDAHARTHDALTEFGALSREDQRHARAGIQAQGLEALLVSAIVYQRGADREFTLAEMREGLKVGLVDRGGDEAGAPRIGAVEGWEPGEDGLLRLIRVRWEDGNRSEHDPVFRELMRPDEALAR